MIAAASRAWRSCAGFSGAGSALPPRKATFAGGCFWCIESDFEKVPGVTKADSGYIGGKKPESELRGGHAGATGHAEAVEIVYDPRQSQRTSKLLDYVYWRTSIRRSRTVSSATADSQYRTAIFTHDETQKNWPRRARQSWRKAEN